MPAAYVNPFTYTRNCLSVRPINFGWHHALSSSHATLPPGVEGFVELQVGVVLPPVVQSIPCGADSGTVEPLPHYASFVHLLVESAEVDDAGGQFEGRGNA